MNNPYNQYQSTELIFHDKYKDLIINNDNRQIFTILITNLYQNNKIGDI